MYELKGLSQEMYELGGLFIKGMFEIQGKKSQKLPSVDIETLQAMWYNCGNPVQEKLQPYVARLQTRTLIQNIEILKRWWEGHSGGRGNFL